MWFYQSICPSFGFNLRYYPMKCIENSALDIASKSGHLGWDTLYFPKMRLFQTNFDHVTFSNSCQSIDSGFIYIVYQFKHTVKKIEIFRSKNWTRVTRKYFNWRFWHRNLILEPQNWKLIKNTWSIEAKILVEKLEIQGHFKVRFLRRNDRMTRIKNI